MVYGVLLCFSLRKIPGDKCSDTKHTTDILTVVKRSCGGILVSQLFHSLTHSLTHSLPSEDQSGGASVCSVWDCRGLPPLSLLHTLPLPQVQAEAHGVSDHTP